MTHDVLPLRRGATGAPVRDLRRRLVDAGHAPAGSHPDTFDDHLEAAVRDFQSRRGLVVDGIVGRDTWNALVEAGHRLGDRLLSVRRPMLRGDDVGGLQVRLGALGFDPGRVDAIFGPDTERAVREFQRNAGLTVDGVCGRDTLAALDRLGSRVEAPAGVGGVRERERLRSAPRQLGDARLVVGHQGGLSAMAHAVARALTERGAHVAVLEDPDPSLQATTANEFGALAYLGLQVDAGNPDRIASYARPGFASIGGRHLADALAEATGRCLAGPVQVVGMQLAVLRETRMPAVVCLWQDAATVVAHGADLAESVASAVETWFGAPTGSDDS